MKPNVRRRLVERHPVRPRGKAQLQRRLPHRSRGFGHGMRERVVHFDPSGEPRRRGLEPKRRRRGQSVRAFPAFVVGSESSQRRGALDDGTTIHLNVIDQGVSDPPLQLPKRRQRHRRFEALNPPLGRGIRGVGGDQALRPDLFPLVAPEAVERLQSVVVRGPCLCPLGGRLGEQRIGGRDVLRDLPIDLLVLQGDDVAGGDDPADQRDRRRDRRQLTSPLHDRIVREDGVELLEAHEAAIGLGAEAAEHRAPQPARDLGILRRFLDPSADHRVGEGEDVVAGERPFAVERLVERHAKGELIGAGIQVAAAILLGRHVRGRAGQRAGAGQSARIGRRGRIGRGRQPRVQHAALGRGGDVSAAG